MYAVLFLNWTRIALAESVLPSICFAKWVTVTAAICCQVDAGCVRSSAVRPMPTVSKDYPDLPISRPVEKGPCIGNQFSRLRRSASPGGLRPR